MSQNYKFKSLQIAGKSKDTKKEKDFIELKVFEVGETKTIDFIMLDGTRQNFAYSHYITSWMGKENEEIVIKIFFATHLVTIYGYCLEKVYQHLSQLKLISLLENDNRYFNNLKESTIFIKKIQIDWKKNK